MQRCHSCPERTHEEERERPDEARKAEAHQRREARAGRGGGRTAANAAAAAAVGGVHAAIARGGTRAGVVWSEQECSRERNQDRAEETVEHRQQARRWKCLREHRIQRVGDDDQDEVANRDPWRVLYPNVQRHRIAQRLDEVVAREDAEGGGGAEQHAGCILLLHSEEPNQPRLRCSKHARRSCDLLLGLHPVEPICGFF